VASDTLAFRLLPVLRYSRGNENHLPGLLRHLRKVFKTCRNYGDHLQYSVFECDLNESERVKLETELNEIINAAEDQVLFVSLGPAESRGARDIRALGLPYLKVDAPCYVV
jgi:CRISPR-associated protein Cas2